MQNNNALLEFINGLLAEIFKTISFKSPQWLYAVPVAVAFLFIMMFFYKKGGKFYRMFTTFVRTVVALLLILSLAGLSVNRDSDTKTTVFTADLSISAQKNEAAVKDFINNALANIKEGDKSAIVAFGQDAAVEKRSDDEGFENGIENFQSYIDGKATNIEAGLGLSSSVIPKNSRKRIVLISDGVETEGNAIAQAQLLNQQGFAIDTFYIENGITKEVQVSKLSVPEYVKTNVGFSIDVAIDSTISTNASLKIYRGNEIVIDERLDIISGENRYTYEDVVDEGGGFMYRAVIDPIDDTWSENNTAYAYTYSDDIPRVLIIEKDGSGEEIRKIIKSTGINVDLLQAEAAPEAVDKLNAYEAVVICDVRAEYLSLEFLNSLDSYVKTTGGGLLVTGGENSYALGGYEGTKLEEMLPVEMEIKTEGEKPSLAMVMVLDRSGSMADSRYGITIMDIAKEAAIRGAEALNSDDYLGVIAFDSQFEWVVRFSQIGENIDQIREQIGSIQPLGGTSIVPAFKEAYNILKDNDSKYKHIILLTDGQAERTGYDGTLATMKARNITLTTVAIGSGADTELLESLAEKGNGRYYYTNEFTDLPEIFVNEAKLASKDYLNNYNFFPVLSSNSEIMSGISELPSLDGYISSKAKDVSQTILQSDKGEPILSTWQYGIGKTVAFTSDADGRWTSRYLSNNKGLDLFKNMVSYIMKTKSESLFEIDARVVSDGAEITVRTESYRDIENIACTVIDDSGKEYNVKLDLTSPGTYRGTLETKQQGAYIATLSARHSDGNIENATGGFSIPYPNEYDIRNFDTGKSLLESIASITGGRVLTSGEQVFSSDLDEVYNHEDITKYLIAAAAVIFVIDVAIRRFASLFKTKPKKEKKANNKKEESIKKSKQAPPAQNQPEPNQDQSKNSSTASALAKNKQKRRR